MQPKPLAIGVFARGIDGYYFGAMLSGIHQAARAAGVPLLMIQSGIEDLLLPTFGAEYVAGWIVLHPDPGEEATTNLAALVASGVPVVTVATALEDVVCTSVVADIRGDTRALVHHLIDHGHRQIAYIDHGPDNWSHERYLGYLDALQERGIALDPTLIIDTAYIHFDIDAALWLERCGEVTARELIVRGMPCTALVAGTDLSAIAAMRVFQEAGYRVPEDIAVVGFDDVAEAQYAQPPLTTVRTRFDQLGRIAAEQLLALLRGEHNAQPRRIYAPPSLLRRRSCGCVGLTEIQARGTQAVAAASDWQATLAWLHKTPASWGYLNRWDDAPLATPGMLNVAGVYQPDSPPVITIGKCYSVTAFPPVDALPLSAQQGQDLTILLPLRAGTEDLGVLALCGRRCAT